MAHSLNPAYSNSHFTICGAGGDRQEWIDGITTLFEEKGVGTPKEFIFITGADVNAYAEHRIEFAGTGYVKAEDYFQPDLTILMIPTDGLYMGRLALLKVNMEARWFDDIIDNMIK